MLFFSPLRNNETKFKGASFQKHLWIHLFYMAPKIFLCVIVYGSLSTCLPFFSAKTLQRNLQALLGAGIRIMH